MTAEKQEKLVKEKFHLAFLHSHIPKTKHFFFSENKLFYNGVYGNKSFLRGEECDVFPRLFNNLFNHVNNRLFMINFIERDHTQRIISFLYDIYVMM